MQIFKLKVLLVIIPLLCNSKSMFGKDLEIYKFYSQRPDIHQLDSSNHKILKPGQKVSVEIYSLLAGMLSGIYADHHLIFLARDAEYAFDIFSLINRKINQDLPLTVSLVNLSRKNIGKANTKEYLQQFLKESGEGPILFIDTCCGGKMVPPISKLTTRVSKFIFLSAPPNKGIPIFRFGMRLVDKNAAYEVLPVGSDWIKKNIELMPHFTSSSDDIVFSQETKRLEAIYSGEMSENLEADLDDSIDPSTSLKIMEEIKYLVTEKIDLNVIKRVKSDFSKFRGIIDQNSRTCLFSELKKYFELNINEKNAEEIRAFVIDVLEISKYHFGFSYQLDPNPIGLKMWFGNGANYYDGTPIENHFIE